MKKPTTKSVEEDRLNTTLQLGMSYLSSRKSGDYSQCSSISLIVNERNIRCRGGLWVALFTTFGR